MLLVTLAACGRIGFDASTAATTTADAVAAGSCQAHDLTPPGYDVSAGGMQSLGVSCVNGYFAFRLSNYVDATLTVTVRDATFPIHIEVAADRCYEVSGMQQLSFPIRAGQAVVPVVSSSDPRDPCGDFTLVTASQ